MATLFGQPKPWQEETHDGQVPGSDFVKVGVIVRRGEHHPQCQEDEEPNDRAAAMRPEIGRSDGKGCPDVERPPSLLAPFLRLRHGGSVPSVPLARVGSIPSSKKLSTKRDTW